MTNSQRKKMPLLGLLAVAATAAVLFAKRVPQPSGPEAPQNDSRAVLARRLGPPAHPSSAAQHILASHDGGLKVPTAATPAADARIGSEFTASYGRSFNPASALFGPTDGWGEGNEASQSQSGPDLETQADESRRHVVVDGDTLTKLADRYLGSKERFLEIFHANRQVLSNPDLLPIGAVLEIPTFPQGKAAQQPPASTGGETISGPQPSISAPALVPVPRGLLGDRDD